MDTPNLGLPFLVAAQAQKHVTHNEALRALDALVHLAVIDRDATTPPGSPGEGDRYIVAAGGTGAWDGHDLEIAAYQDGAWAFFAPRAGWRSWIGDEELLAVWDGSAWSPVGSGSGGDGDFDTVGINATADETNRLADRGGGIAVQSRRQRPSAKDQQGRRWRYRLGTVPDRLFRPRRDGPRW